MFSVLSKRIRHREQLYVKYELSDRAVDVHFFLASTRKPYLIFTIPRV